MALTAADTVPVCCARCDALTRNGRRYADLLGLRDWVVEVDHEAPRDVSAIATVTIAPGRRHLVLRAGPVFDELEPEDRRHALTHELVHAIVNDLWLMHEAVAQEAYGGVAYRVHIDHAKRELEATVDHMASVWQAMMPEFEW